MNTLRAPGAALAATLITLPALAQTSSTARVEHAQDKQSRHIARQKHDAQRAP